MIKEKPLKQRGQGITHVGTEGRMEADLLPATIQDRRKRGILEVLKKIVNLESYFSKIYFKNKARVNTRDI